jgi:hypothetical protein
MYNVEHNQKLCAIWQPCPIPHDYNDRRLMIQIICCILKIYYASSIDEDLCSNAMFTVDNFFIHTNNLRTILVLTHSIRHIEPQQLVTKMQEAP